MSDDLPARLRACVTLAAAYRLMDEAASELERLRAAMVHVRAHTGTLPNATPDLMLGLLASIERIADAALKETP